MKNSALVYVVLYEEMNGTSEVIAVSRSFDKAEEIASDMDDPCDDHVKILEMELL